MQVILYAVIKNYSPGEQNMKTALVVDDEPLMRRQVMETLDSYGFERVIEASDGAQAVNLIALGKPLLVVMDVQMPLWISWLDYKPDFVAHSGLVRYGKVVFPRRREQ